MRGVMSGITQKSCVALFPLWSFQKTFFRTDNHNHNNNNNSSNSNNNNNNNTGKHIINISKLIRSSYKYCFPHCWFVHIHRAVVIP